MSLDEFRRIVNRFERFRFSEITFNLINEPFVDQTLCDKIAELAESHTSVDSRPYDDSSLRSVAARGGSWARNDL
jgi:hypothetical protein